MVNRGKESATRLVRLPLLRFESLMVSGTYQGIAYSPI